MTSQRSINRNNCITAINEKTSPDTKQYAFVFINITLSLKRFSHSAPGEPWFPRPPAICAGAPSG
jgi:hypothetical protein